MGSESNYKEINRKSWNKRTDIHFDSEFYDNKSFLQGKNSLNKIELDILGDVKGKSILHLQCHFGQDTISLSRMGAHTTGVDLSDRAIERANELAKTTGVDANFVCCDIYDLPSHLEDQFDIVFTSYGTIGWLPDMDKWADIVGRYLKLGGLFVMAEFHPVVWMFDDDFSSVKYNYFNSEAIVETESGTYTDRDASISEEYVSWNHSISEVLNSLLKQGLELQLFEEYDYSPYNCFQHTFEGPDGEFRIKHMGNKIPMVYAISAHKNKGNGSTFKS